MKRTGMRAQLNTPEVDLDQDPVCMEGFDDPSALIGDLSPDAARRSGLSMGNEFLKQTLGLGSGGPEDTDAEGDDLGAYRRSSGRVRSSDSCQVDADANPSDLVTGLVDPVEDERSVLENEPDSCEIMDDDERSDSGGEAENLDVDEDAQAQGESKASPEVDAQTPSGAVDDAGADMGPCDAPTVDAPDIHGQTPLAAMPPGNDSGLAGFQASKSGPLSRWDTEVTWHDYFAGGDAAEGIEIDRDALILDALGSGALAGFKEGIKGVGIGVAINLASRNIPFVQGFVELGRIAYDPAAWFEGQSQNTVGRMSKGFEQILSGDPIDFIEGVLNVVDGTKNVIGLLSSICWIVAAAGSLVSLICPAVFPFVVLCASWATTLGALSTLVGLYVTMGRLGVVGLRALQIKYGDADPATLLEQGERLHAQAQGFTEEFTGNLGQSLVERGSGKLKSYVQGDTGPASQPHVNMSSEKPPSVMSRVASVMTGNIGGSGAIGSGLDSAHADVKKRLAISGDVTSIYAGEGSAQQKLNDMETAGETVYPNPATREKINKELTTNGEGDGVNAAGQKKLAELEAQRDGLLVETEKITKERQESVDYLVKQQESLAQAQKQLAAVEESNGGALIRTKQAEVEERGALLDSYKQDLSSAESQLSNMQSHKEVIAEMHSAHPSDATTEAMKEVDRQIQAASDAVQQQEKNVKDAEQYLSDGKDELVTLVNAQQSSPAVISAKNATTQAQEAVNSADSSVQGYDHALSTKHSAMSEAKREVNVYQPPPGGLSDAQWAEEQSRFNSYRWWLDWGGKGPNRLSGTGSSSRKLGKEIGKGMKRSEDTPAGGPLGLWRATLDDAPMDLWGDAGGRGEQDYAAQLSARYSALSASLPAPPLALVPQVDGAAESFAAIDEEERQIGFQLQVMDSLVVDGQTQLNGLEVMQELARANAQAAEEHDDLLNLKLDAQGDLAESACEVQQKGEEHQTKANEGQGLMGGFFSRFMTLMGMVPSRIIGDAAEGAEGAKQLNQSVTDQSAVADKQLQGADQMSTQATNMQGDTSAASADATLAASQFTQAEQQAINKELEAMDGMELIEATREDAATRLTSIAAEKERLKGEHAAAISTMAGWSDNHHDLRVSGLGELDGIVQLVDNPGN